jgi:sec-independent protein translocase protein TatA
MGFGSPIHWLVIGIVALLLFGNRLPEVARSLGKAWNEFKRGLNEVSDELKADPPADTRNRLEPPTDRSELNNPVHDESDAQGEREEEHAHRHD